MSTTEHPQPATVQAPEPERGPGWWERITRWGGRQITEQRAAWPARKQRGRKLLGYGWVLLRRYVRMALKLALGPFGRSDVLCRRTNLWTPRGTE